MKLRLTHNLGEAARRYERLGGQFAFGLAYGLTKTAKQAEGDLYAVFPQVFDRPTPYSMRALRITAATKAKLEALIAVKGYEQSPTGAVPPDAYLAAQIEGGRRRQKRFEARLRMLGVLNANEVAVPAAGARLDAYGNVVRGQVVQILSQLGSAPTLGDYSAATNSRRSRAKRSKVAYFASRGKSTLPGKRSWRSGEKEQHLPRGVWARYQFAVGTAVKPVFLFVRAPSYAKRLDFYGIVGARVDRSLEDNVTEGLERALATAR